jgi:hypothetical protein
MPAAACFGQDPHRVLMPTLALVREGPPPGSGRDTPPGGTAYPDTPRSHGRQPVAGVALLKPARAVARATPTTPDRISGYMELSTSR